MIANARMYAIGGAAAAWRTLLEWVVARAGVSCDVIDYPPPQPLTALWARPDLGCAFMCGYPFSTTVPQPTLLAAPVPNPAPHGGRPIYWTDIVVAAESRLERLEDTFDATFAWTSEDSYSGLARAATPARAARAASRRSALRGHDRSAGHAARGSGRGRGRAR